MTVGHEVDETVEELDAFVAPSLHIIIIKIIATIGALLS
jgi:hypothetical protein